MTPDQRSRPASRAPRAPARFVAGLALLAVIAACGSNHGGVIRAGSTPAPTTPAMTVASPNATGVSPNSTSVTALPNRTQQSPEGTTIRADGIDGPYRLLIPRIQVNARVVPIQSNEQRVLNPPPDPGVAGWWSDGAAPGESQ